MLKEHPYRIIVMLSKDWFYSFIERKDVKKDMYELNPSEKLSYMIYENKNIVSCKFYGRMNFEMIGGIFMLKECDFMGYKPYGYEPRKIFYFE